MLPPPVPVYWALPNFRRELHLELSTKQEQFNAAMELYTSTSRYRLFGILIAIANVSVQIYLLFRVWPYSIGLAWQLLSVLIAYVVADFVNGLVHMFMDGNDRYDSIAGPLIANFHMHHKIPKYQKHNLLIVYFMESGSKIWLVGYLLAVVALLGVSGADPRLLYILVYVGILSSVAEVSHYLCHTSTSAVAMFLGKTGVLLSKRHHASHHLADNNSYAFLNGYTDPLLNLIAKKFSGGYKKTTDLHYAAYTSDSSESR